MDLSNIAYEVLLKISLILIQSQLEILRLHIAISHLLLLSKVLWRYFWSQNSEWFHNTNLTEHIFPPLSLKWFLSFHFEYFILWEASQSLKLQSLIGLKCLLLYWYSPNLWLKSKLYLFLFISNFLFSILDLQSF